MRDRKTGSTSGRELAIVGVLMAPGQQAANPRKGRVKVNAPALPPSIMG